MSSGDAHLAAGKGTVNPLAVGVSLRPILLYLSRTTYSIGSVSHMQCIDENRNLLSWQPLGTKRYSQQWQYAAE